MTDAETPPGLVAVPAVPWMFTRAAESFMRLAVNLPEGSDLRFFRGGTTIARKRNKALHKAGLFPDKWKWVLQVDSDMTPPPDAAHSLWAAMEEADADAAAALFTGTTLKGAVPHVIPGAEEADMDPREYAVRHDDLVEIEKTGGGCFMVRTEIIPDLPSNPFAGNQDNYAEETSFWRAFQERGYKLVRDLGTEVGHLDVYPFGVGSKVTEVSIHGEGP